MADKDSLENFTEAERDAMARMYDRLVKDPKTRDVTLRATKTVAPETNIPEIEVMDRVAHAMTPHLTEIAALKKDKLEREVKDRLTAARQKLRDDAGMNQKDIDAVEKIMVEKHIPDHATAAEFYTMQNRTATPTPESWSNPVKMPGNADGFKKAGGFKNFFRNDAHAAVDELHNGQIKIH